MNIKKMASDIDYYIKEAAKATELYKANQISQKGYRELMNIIKAQVNIQGNKLNFELSLIKEKLDKLKELEREDVDD